MIKAIDPADLDEAIMTAHVDDDRFLLCSLYLRAGEIKETAGDIDAACFLFTTAYVFGLDSGNEDRAAAHARLVEYGRDQ